MQYPNKFHCTVKLQMELNGTDFVDTAVNKPHESPLN